MGLEVGFARALSVRPNWEQKMANDRSNIMLAKQAQDQAAAKAKLFADDMAYTNVLNEYDNPIIKEGALKTTSKLGTFTRENPGWERDVSKRVEFDNIRRELKDNPDLNRGLVTQDNYKQWRDWAVKNPELANSPDGQAIAQQWQSYVKAPRGANTSPFTFVPPELFDSDKVIAESFGKLKAKDRMLTSKEFGAPVGLGATISDVPEEELKTNAQSLWKDPRWGYKFAGEWKNMLSDTDRSFYGNDPVKWLAERGKPKTDRNVKTGSYLDSIYGGNKNGKDSSGGYSAFMNDIGNQPRDTITFSNNTAAISPVINNQLPVSGPVRVLTTDAKGNKNWVVLDSYKGMTLKAINTGRVMLGPKGEPLVEVKLNEAPMTNELVYGKSPLFKSNSFIQSTFDANENAEEIPAYQSVARLKLGENGKPTGQTDMTAWVDAITTPSTIREYDKLASGQKAANDAEGSAIGTLDQRSMINNSTINNSRINQNVGNKNIQNNTQNNIVNKYYEVRVNQSTGDKIGFDGKNWVDVKTGKKVI